MAEQNAYEFFGVDRKRMFARTVNLSRENNVELMYEHEIIDWVLNRFSQQPQKLTRFAETKKVTLMDLAALKVLPDDFAYYCNETAAGGNIRKVRDLMDKNLLDFTKADFSIIGRITDWRYDFEPVFVTLALIKETACFAKFLPESRPAESLLARVLQEAKANPELGAELATLLLKQAAADPKLRDTLADVVNKSMRRSEQVPMGVPG